jgi:hypothetical protein
VRHHFRGCEIPKNQDWEPLEHIFKVRTEFQAMPRCRHFEIAGLLNPFLPPATGLLALGHLSFIHDQLPVGKIKDCMGSYQVKEKLNERSQ